MRKAHFKTLDMKEAFASLNCPVKSTDTPRPKPGKGEAWIKVVLWLHLGRCLPRANINGDTVAHSMQ
jgi:hypothetical protein